MAISILSLWALQNCISYRFLFVIAQGMVLCGHEIGLSMTHINNYIVGIGFLISRISIPTIFPNYNLCAALLFAPLKATSSIR
jgi:hypothetical protein